MSTGKGPCLYIVGTPIGNLGDLTFRAKETIEAVDAVAAEDTRITKKLLSHLGIRKKMIPCHEHNERKAATTILSMLDNGQSVALLSDAGTPLLSDPGAEVVNKVRAAGYPVIPIPGVSAVACAISASGLKDGRFIFQGFLPQGHSQRASCLKQLASCNLPVMLYESPHRLLKLLDMIVKILGDIRIFFAREMTKIHEEYRWTSAEELCNQIRNSGVKGEITLILMPGADKDDRDAHAIPAHLERIIEMVITQDEGDTRFKPGIKNLANDLAMATGVSKTAIYNRMIQLKRGKIDSEKEEQDR